MHGFKGERVLMRVHVEEQDKHDGTPLYEAIVMLLHRQGFAGATAFKGALGFGAGGRMHEDHTFQLKEDLPIIVECIDSEEKIQSILPDLDKMIGGGLITLERVRVIMYRNDLTAEQRVESDRIDVTGNWGVVE